MEIKSINIFKISKIDQYHTVDELFKHSKPNTSYYTLLFISAIIVASGLLVNNIAVVLGGMLVAPVLTPLLVVGLGLATGESGAIKSVSMLILKSVLIIVFVSALLSFLFGRPVDTFVLTDNIRSTALYFIIAVASGMAGAFAWAKKEISEVLPGVSIAVSVVPPLSLIGIWFNNLLIVRFYFLVFAFNFLGIIAGSVIVFSLLKFFRAEGEIKKDVQNADEELVA